MVENVRFDEMLTEGSDHSFVFRKILILTILWFSKDVERRYVSFFATLRPRVLAFL
jgi:hypothetical protein